MIQMAKGNADWPDKELNFLTFSIMQLNWLTNLQHFIVPILWEIFLNPEQLPGSSARPLRSMIKPTMTTYMCIAAQILLLESEPLLLLHMPRTATFVPRTAHFVAEAPLFSFHVVFACTVGESLRRRVAQAGELTIKIKLIYDLSITSIVNNS